jgi:hypothetical protein
MRQKCLFAGLAGTFTLLLAISGCRNNPTQPPAPPVTVPTSPPTSSTPQTTQSNTPLKDSIEAYLAQHSDGNILPKNVRLLGVKIDSGVATLDFSKEFQQLANMGDSTEAEVQRELRKLVAKFPNVEKMRVTVEGGHFDSQMTDWYEPFPVRDDASAEDVTQKPGESEGGQ